MCGVDKKAGVTRSGGDTVAVLLVAVQDTPTQLAFHPCHLSSVASVFPHLPATPSFSLDPKHSEYHTKLFSPSKTST